MKKNAEQWAAINAARQAIDSQQQALNAQKRDIDAQVGVLNEQIKNLRLIERQEQIKLVIEHAEILLKFVDDHDGECTDEDRYNNDSCTRCILLNAIRDKWIDDELETKITIRQNRIK